MVKSKTITIRVTDEEAKKISEHAKNSGMGVGTYLRMKGLE
jgi:predicted DNA binding CopG/RHH family protein